MDTRRPQRQLERADDEFATIKRWIIWTASGITALIVLFTFLGSFYTIQEYERGVLTRNGAFVRILNPGFGIKVPWIDNIPEEIDLRVKTYTWAKMEAYSGDQQLASLKVSATIRAKESRIEQLYKNHRNVTNAVSELLSPIMNKDVKIVFGQYVASRAIQERGALNLDVLSAVLSALGSDTVLEIIGVQIEDVSFSKVYETSIEERMTQEVAVAKHKQKLEYERVQAQIVQTQADAEAYQIKAKGDAEAAAIRARAKALAENPSLIGLVAAEKWNGELPTTMIPGAAVPMVPLPKGN